MRALLAALFVLSLFVVPTQTSAQEREDREPGGALSMQNYLALSNDQEAQLSFGGFRSYLERVQHEEPELYSLLDERLDVLEDRETTADYVFGFGAVISTLSLIAAIPTHEVVGLDPALGFVVGGSAGLLITLIVQAILRPGHSDLMALIDAHDRSLGRR